MSAFVSENGLLQTCGFGGDGALGQGGFASDSRPQLVQALLIAEVRRVAIGARHMAAITGTCIHASLSCRSCTAGDHQLWTWGHGECLQLGLDTRASHATPQLVRLERGIVPTAGCGAVTCH